jgi:BrxA
LIRFNSNIQKGGALLDDARRVVEVWDLKVDATSNLTRIAEQNLLAKPSRARAEDVLRRVLRPRLVQPGPHVLAALKELIHSPRSFTEAYYFEAARDDELLAAFAEGPLFGWWQHGRLGIDFSLVMAWLDKVVQQGEAPPWTDTVRTKIARGLLAALRDFGVLTGGVRKEFAQPSLTIAGFAYVAFRLHESGASSRALLASPVWSRWMLDQGRVTELFHEAARHGLLRYSSAGSAVRVDWLQESLSEVVRALA